MKMANATMRWSTPPSKKATLAAPPPTTKVYKLSVFCICPHLLSQNKKHPSSRVLVHRLSTLLYTTSFVAQNDPKTPQLQLRFPAFLLLSTQDTPPESPLPFSPLQPYV